MNAIEIRGLKKSFRGVYALNGLEKKKIKLIGNK